MQDFVTPETAIELCKKGFPQPEKKFGQVWYMLHVGQPILVGSALGNELEKYPHVFAPRATDIMRHLDSIVNLSFDKDSGLFELWHGEGAVLPNFVTHESAAELMAAVYLKER